MQVPVYGTIVTWKTKLVDIELQPGTNPYHAKLYLLPSPHEDNFYKEV